MVSTDKDFLFDLLDTPSPTGFEMPGQRVWAKHIGKHADSVDCDSYGSTWATLAGSSDQSIMLAAHADEIGYMIKHVTEEGFLYIDRIGGSDAATGQGRRIHILGDKGTVTGIIGNTAIHLRRDSLSSEKAPAIDQLWVDVGASSPEEVADLGIRIGHPAVYQEAATELANNRLVSRALDNRIGGYIIAKVMGNIAAKPQQSSHSVICLNTVQEETSGAGARMATHRLKPSICICVDVTHATDTPGLDAKKHGEVKLGKGPTVMHGTANHPLLVDRLMQVADKHDIAIQHEASSNFTGTDTDTIYDVNGGVPSALVSLPIRCMHSVVETAHWDDIEATIELLTELINSLSKDDTFSQTL